MLVFLLSSAAYRLDVKLVNLEQSKRRCAGVLPAAVGALPEDLFPVHLCWTYAWGLQDRLATVSERTKRLRSTAKALDMPLTDTLDSVLHLHRRTTLGRLLKHLQGVRKVRGCQTRSYCCSSRPMRLW